MLKIIYILVLIIAFLLGAILKKNKDYITPILMCLFLIILMGGQEVNQDYEIYKNIFNGEFYTKDFGFGCIIQILKYLGFTQDNFRLGIAIIGFILITITVFRLLNKRSLFYVFYAIYPFLFDVVQARNFLVMSILIFAIPYLIEDNKRNRIIYICLILLAASIQKIALIYLPIVFIKGIADRGISKNLIKIIGIISIIFAFNRNFLNVFISNIIIPITGTIQEVSNYASINTNNGWIIFWLEQIFAYSLIWFANFINKKYEVLDNFKTNKQQKFLKLMLDVNYYMFIFLPLFILDENYTRIIRNIIPLTIIAILIVLYNGRNKIYLTKYSMTLVVLTISYQIFMFFLMARSYWESIVLTTFNNNWIFNLF